MERPDRSEIYVNDPNVFAQKRGWYQFSIFSIVIVIIFTF